MKINELKINSYGKLKNKNIELKDGINIIYGENEKGKSTLLNCIVNLLYGTSKNKKGKDISDYDRFKPWDTEDFSGKIKYTLDNNESYEVFREFGKKNPKIYNKNMEDISKLYSIDKNAGNQFFTEQTGVDEKTFISTVVSFQSATEIDTSTQNVLLQKIANTSSTGDDGISYKKAIEKLNKKQLDEIGTNRSQGKPINIVISELEKLTSTNDELKQYENFKYEIEDRKYKIENELQEIKNKNEFLTKLNNINQEQTIENEKLKYSENKIDELEDKIQKLIDEKEAIKSKLKETKKIEKKSINFIPYTLIMLLCVGISIILYFATKNIASSIPLIIAIVDIILFITKIKKVKSNNKKKEDEFDNLLRHNKNIEKSIYEIEAQIEILENNKEEQVAEAESLKNKIIKEIESKKAGLKSEYEYKVNTSNMSYLNNSNLQEDIDQNNKIMNEKNMELHKIDLNKENIMRRLEELAENEEKISYNKNKYNELVNKNNAINMAKEIIENAYLKMKNDVTPKFTENLSKNISNITNNKYNRLVINEEEGILVELENGEYKSANLLSKGTIEQLYLAFRLAIIEDISQETMPIIFDEIFAYFDDNRLKETLVNMDKNYSKKHQIVLFTCTKREEQTLKELGIAYNLISL